MASCPVGLRQKSTQYITRIFHEQLIIAYGFNIPEDTVFIGGSHNTTTDEIVLFDDHIPECHKQTVKVLKEKLKAAQKEATAERLGSQQKSVELAVRKANDWAETRPEWGLAKNSGFIYSRGPIVNGEPKPTWTVFFTLLQLAQ